MSDTKETGVSHEPTVAVLHPKRRWVSYFWDTLDKTKEERRFMFKLDSALLTIACLGLSQVAVADRGFIVLTWRPGFFIKFMDQINVNVAFVSGMLVQIAN